MKEERIKGKERHLPLGRGMEDHRARGHLEGPESMKAMGTSDDFILRGAQT